MSKFFTEIIPKLNSLPAIRFLILDVDGVMTDGKIGYTETGDELKYFDAKDGAGIKYWLRSGHQAGIITGRVSATVPRRGAELGITRIAMNAKDKLPAAEKMLSEAGVAFSETVVIGDDLPDIPLIRRAGLGVAVGDAADEVKEAAHCVTERNGGGGAVRETIEAVLKAQSRWQDVVRRYCQ